MSETKQVLVIRKDLNMRAGKMAAQAAHASMKVLLDRMGVKYHLYDQGDGTSYGREDWILSVDDDSPMREWLNGSFAKIVTYVNSKEELLVLKDNAESIHIPTALIIDSGRTEFRGVPTVTALAIGPDKTEKIDKVTGDLPLL